MRDAFTNDARMVFSSREIMRMLQGRCPRLSAVSRKFVKWGKPRGYLQPASEKPATPKRPEGITNELEILTRAA
ncbi:hypothetical protein GCM10027413_09620 [Conyzicola nivalis]|uniref:Uncharacterized protein n=1 Tax=Conyzicola nivalis TaxID=1477021 RepID=A0A916WJ42_9MICO|nr:hypothetical protein GCM10010979_17010 [Conyzicola nivalis]